MPKFEVGDVVWVEPSRYPNHNIWGELTTSIPKLVVNKSRHGQTLTLAELDGTPFHFGIPIGEDWVRKDEFLTAVRKAKKQSAKI